MRRIAISVLLGLWGIQSFSQARDIERAMTRASGKSLDQVEKKEVAPESVTRLVILDHADTVFPNPTLLKFTNLQHLTIWGRPVRATKKDEAQPPLALRIDTALLAQMSSLRTLQLIQFDLRGSLDELFRLQKIQGLALNLCLLDSLPGSISDLSDLEVLDVSLNYMTDLPGSMAKLERLKVLMLDNNHFRSLPAVVLEMDSLEVLELGNREVDRELDGAKNLRWPFPFCTNHFDWETDTVVTGQLLQCPQLRKVRFPRDECSDPLYFNRAFPQKRSTLKVKWDPKPHPCPDTWPERTVTRFELPMKAFTDKGNCLCGLRGY